MKNNTVLYHHIFCWILSVKIFITVFHSIIHIIIPQILWLKAWMIKTWFIIAAYHEDYHGYLTYPWKRNIFTNKTGKAYFLHLNFLCLSNPGFMSYSMASDLSHDCKLISYEYITWLVTATKNIAHQTVPNMPSHAQPTFSLWILYPIIPRNEWLALVMIVGKEKLM